MSNEETREVRVVVVAAAHIEIMKDETATQTKKQQVRDHRNRTSLLNSNSRLIAEQMAWGLSDNEWESMDREAMMTMPIHHVCNTMDSTAET